MRILVTGSDGMLGWAIKRVFTDDELILTNRKTFDITKWESVKNFPQRPDIIFHCAAETDHFRAEVNDHNTYMVNHTGTMNVVELARTLGCPIVYIGTCGIFDGSKESYDELDTPCPLNHYGRSKYYGELAVESYDRHFIVRSGWGMGGGKDGDKKFLGKIYRRFLTNPFEVPAITDVYGSPTYFVDLANTIKRVIKYEWFGTYNCSSPDKASRYDVAKAFFSVVSPNIKVIPMTYKEYHKAYGLDVAYTKCEVLDTWRVESLGLSEMRPWKEAVLEYAEMFK